MSENETDDAKARDIVWLAALEQIKEEGRLKQSDLDVNASSAMIRDVLNQMEKEELLYREEEGARIWFAGPLAKDILSMDEDAVQRSILF